jgi:hypothetical protein
MRNPHITSDHGDSWRDPVRAPDIALISACYAPVIVLLFSLFFFIRQ